MTYYDGPETEEAEVEEVADEAAVEDIDGEVAEKVEEDAPAEAEVAEWKLSDEDNEWLKGKDMSLVRKNTDEWTKTHELTLTEQREIAKQRIELAPVLEFQKALQTDPGAVAALERYYSTEAEDAPVEKRVEGVEGRLNSIANHMAVEREVNDLTHRVQTEGTPAFDVAELLEFAGSKGMPSLEAAYEVKYASAIRDAAVAKAIDDIKDAKKAKVEVRPKAQVPTSPTSLEDREEMSDADFLKFYQSK